MAPAVAQEANDLYDRPVLAVDPGKHTSRIWSMALDSEGRFAVTGSSDRTVRIWSLSDGKLRRTIWIPVGPDPIGEVYATAISPDGSTVAAGGWTERMSGGTAIYLFDRESGAMIRRIRGDLPDVVLFLAFSPDGRYVAAALGGRNGGVRVFDRDKDWEESFRDEYDGRTNGAAFAPDGRLATTSYGSGGTIRLYDRNFRLVGRPVKAPSGNFPTRIAFSPDGKQLAVGYSYIAAVDLLDGKSLKLDKALSPTNLPWVGPAGLANVAWSRDGRVLLAAGTALFAWDQAGFGAERRLPYCGSDSISGLDAMPDAASSSCQWSRASAR